ncbi:unnamed protein product [Triticum aestivum]|uniref:Uncharacterized protein n=2 Tax=Triticum aestivum TaxID=4565 RepID=A0A9R1EU44_WHEAT|nr:hypothetical protein CFC21_030055 [Triticum aestivum]SPT18343.1 unnamed protein product [Triticum aestivum]
MNSLLDPPVGGKKNLSPEHDGGEEGQHGDSAGGGAAQVNEHLSSRLALLPPLLALDEHLVPRLGLLPLSLASPPPPLHCRGEQPEGALAAHRRAVGVLHSEADLADVPGLLGAGHGGLEVAPSQHHREPHQHLAGVPVPAQGHRPPARHVHRPAAGGVDDHPAQLELRRGERRRHRRRLLAVHGLDAERRAEEPRRRRGRLHDAVQHGLAPVVHVHRGDEPRGEAAGAGLPGVRARERGRVGEEAARRHRGEEPVLGREGRPLGEAKRAPRVRVRGERAEPRRGAARGGQRAAVEAAQRAGQHVRVQVLDRSHHVVSCGSWRSGDRRWEL